MVQPTNNNAGAINVSFKSGKYYNGAYRFRIRTNTSNQCTNFECFASDWVYYPTDATENNTPTPGTWRKAVEAAWDGGPEDGVFGLYPNPTTESVTLTLPEGETGNYQVVNLSGQVVSQGKANGPTEIDTKSLRKGVYAVRFTGKGFNTQKLVIQ